MTRRWSSLTTELNTRSPVRRFLDQRFLNLRGAQRQYAQQVGPILVPAEPGLNTGTLGGVFDCTPPDMPTSARGICHDSWRNSRAAP